MQCSRMNWGLMPHISIAFRSLKRPACVSLTRQNFIHSDFLTALAEGFHGRDSPTFEKSAVTKFDAKKKRARANRYWINYDRVVLATNNPLLGESSLITGAFFQTKLALYSSYVVGGTVPRGSIPIASFWDTNDPYQYLRVDRHGDSDYAIFG